MRTDERAGQAAKHKLKSLEDRLRDDESRHPDSLMPSLSHWRPDSAAIREETQGGQER